MQLIGPNVFDASGEIDFFARGDLGLIEHTFSQTTQKGRFLVESLELKGFVKEKIVLCQCNYLPRKN